jgi:hypothetical protein
MIKFFRKIRQQLLTENKLSKYLIYAIGEILLIVFGILIAVSINNYNEDKKAQAKERFALAEIISDLDVNIKTLNGIIYNDDNSISDCINSLNIIIKNIEQTQVYNDSLANHFWLTFRFPVFDLKVSGYESLTSIGIDIISENELRSKIGTYYSYSIPIGKAAYMELRDDFYHYMLDLLTNEFITVGTENETKKVVPVNYELLLKNRKYIECLKTYIAIFNYYKEASVEISDQSKKLKKQIEYFLNKST